MPEPRLPPRACSGPSAAATQPVVASSCRKCWCWRSSLCKRYTLVRVSLLIALGAQAHFSR